MLFTRMALHVTRCHGENASLPGRQAPLRKLAAVFSAVALLVTALSPLPAAAEEAPFIPAAREEYVLDKVVVLSRHNIRSPMSGSGSMLGELTPHPWFDWTSEPSELSVRGGVLETIMGQYFRLWLEKEGLFPENYQPEEGAVRFFANSKQRTIATSTFFSAGLLPVWDTPVERHVEYDTMDPVFFPRLNFVTPSYTRDVISQISESGGIAGPEGIKAGLYEAFSLLMDVTDLEESEAYQSGSYGNLLEDPVELILEEGKEPAMKGPIKTATSLADALTLQYYEEPDAAKAAFGHELTDEDWRLMHSIVDTYSEMLFAAPLVSVNVAHPLLEEIRSELLEEDRKFSFLCGHDSNLCSVLSALGVEEYELPDTVEPKTPIGAKLVFARYLSAENEAYYTVSLVYQSTEQLRDLSLLSLENPPAQYFLEFDGAEANEDHMIAEEDLLGLFDKAISAYDSLLEKYTEESTEQTAAARLIEDMILYYGCYGEAADEEVDDLLWALKKTDLRQGLLWEDIMDYWKYADTDMAINTGELPDSLPEDDSLAIVIMGSGLNADGSMREELPAAS